MRCGARVLLWFHEPFPSRGHNRLLPARRRAHDVVVGRELFARSRRRVRPRGAVRVGEVHAFARVRPHAGARRRGAVLGLSGGQAARVALLRAFATRPRVLLLDEVDAALDDESARAVGRLTKSLVDDRMACLRIRHRAADGVACGTFSLRDGALSYASRADADGEGTRS